jgi:lipopolysaccharide/colanic/teichoic acid biosynthesis glycosyltransferase
MLIEPGQLVLLDIGELSERLTWHDSAVTRVRLVDRERDGYSEHVVVDQDGVVERIERRYLRHERTSNRVTLSRRRRLAQIWMSATSGREAWSAVRRAVPWARVDHYKTNGQVCVYGKPGQERKFIDELVGRWACVSQSIAGVEEFAPGVWCVAGQSLDPNVVRLGPYWIGLGDMEPGRQCIVGPGWSADVPDLTSSESTGVTVRPIGEVEVAETTSHAGPVAHRRFYPFVKRLIDIFASVVALVVLSPLLLLISLLVWKQDRGPVFFRHTRQGRHGQPFECLKFRTMHTNAEAFAHELEDQNLADGPQVYILDDPRVTPLGRKLRRWHFDELPQFWNVLVGNMSLVGPRPSPDDENRYCPAWRETRLSVRPGITGLWQLKRTRQVGEDFQEWIKYDMQYVRKAGIWMDIKILVRTCKAYLPGR